MGPLKLSRISLFSFMATLIVPTLAQNITTSETEICGGISGLLQCGTGFPSEFCCPTTATCTPLNSTGVIAAICCPKGQVCDFIQPITCDVNQLNATLHPDNQIHLSDTKDVKLPKCGQQCCPLGYECASGMCSAITTAASTTSSPSPTTLPTQPPSVSQTEAAIAPPAPVSTDQGFNGGSFAAGLFPGIVLGALGTLGLIWIIKKRRERQERARYSGDFGHVARTISDPIYDPQFSGRADFVRRDSKSTKGHPSPNSTTGMVMRGKEGGGGMTPKLLSIWERTPKLGFGGFGANANINNKNNANPRSSTNLGTTLLSGSSNLHPRPPPPAVRAGYHIDPYTTPNRTPKSHRSSSRSHSRSSKAKYNPQTQHQRPASPLRSISTETIDVLMPAPSFLAPPKMPVMRENRMTGNSVNTTFTGLMERAGYEEGTRNDVRNHKGRAI